MNQLDHRLLIFLWLDGLQILWRFLTLRLALGCGTGGGCSDSQGWYVKHVAPSWLGHCFWRFVCLLFKGE